MDDKYWMIWAGFMVIGMGIGMLLGELNKGTMLGLILGFAVIYYMIRKKIFS